MLKKSITTVVTLVALLILPGLAWSQAAQQNSTLIVSGQPGQAPVLQINGRSYVDIEALARLTNGSLGFKGNQITLTLPGAAASAPSTATAPSQPASPGFSKEFMRAGIEEMSVIREWRSALLNAVQNGKWISRHRCLCGQLPRAGSDEPQVGIGGRVNRFRPKRFSTAQQ